MPLEQQGTIDIYSANQLPRIDQLLIMNENEHGHAGYIAMSGLLTSDKPFGHISSHLIANMVFNQTVEPSVIGWPFYVVGSTAILNINEWPATPLYPLEESKATWIYIYPVIRDTLMFFNSLGCNQIRYSTSLSIHEALEPETFPAMSEDMGPVHIEYEGGRFVSSDSNDTDLQSHAFLTPPAWLFPSIASYMGWATSLTTAVGFDPNKKVHETAAKVLLEYLCAEHLIEPNEENFTKAIDEMNSYNDRADTVRAEMEDLIKGRPANNTMWG